MFFKKLLKSSQLVLLSKLSKVPRAAIIFPSMIGSTFLIHNGRRLKKLSVVRSYVGFKCGEFCFTRRLVKHKIKKKKK